VIVVQPPAEPQRARAAQCWIQRHCVTGVSSASAFPSPTSIAISGLSTSTIGSASERSPSRKGRHGGTAFSCRIFLSP
jgi:hypothetical protein